jgi:type IV secretory pathway VirB4 component
MAKPTPTSLSNTSHLEKEQAHASMLNAIAPAAFLLTADHITLDNLVAKTLFVYTYPHFLETNWLYQMINMDLIMDVSMFIYPVETNTLLPQLRRKATQLEATLSIEQEKGLVRNPELEAAITDVEQLRDVLTRGETRLFHYGLYLTIYGRTNEELESAIKQVESYLGGALIYSKQAYLQMEQGFNSTVPMGTDELYITRNLDTNSLSTTFPFTSASLTSNEGVLYAINRHNNSLVLFDRFNLENANSLILGRSGSGKSYVVKLEILRSLMLGSDVIVIDPENEYRALADAIGGTYLNFSLNSTSRINPLELPPPYEGETGEDIMRTAVVTAHSLISLMVGGLTPEEDNILDQTLLQAYASKGITTDIRTHQRQAPVLTDVVTFLNTNPGARNLVARLTKYISGTFAGLFNQPTNINLNNGFLVFSIRDLEEQLRPIASYMILTFIWNKIRHELRRRILIIDEVWTLLQHEDSAAYLYSFAKRARKYYLGMTTISQDVEDFLDSKYGRSIINNTSLQILLKQSTSAIEKVAAAFNLTEGEKLLLLESDIGEGLFFAGQSHIAIKVIASYSEDLLITTNPEEILAARAIEETQARAVQAQQAQLTQPQAQPAAPVAASPATPTAQPPAAQAPLPPQPVQPPTQQG